MQNAYYVEGSPDAIPAQLLGTGRPLSDHRRPAGHSRLARRPAGPRLPRRGARRRHARRHGSRERIDRRRRLRLPGRPCRPRADAAGRRRRRWSGAEGLRNDRPQRPRPRDRPAHHRQGRGRQDRGQDLRQRHASKSLRASPRRSRSRRASARCRCRFARSPTMASELERAVAAGDVKVPAGANPAQEKQMLLAMANRPLDSNTTFIDRWRRVALPAPHRPGHSRKWRWPRPSSASVRRPLRKSRMASASFAVARGN